MLEPKDWLRCGIMKILKSKLIYNLRTRWVIRYFIDKREFIYTYGGTGLGEFPAILSNIKDYIFGAHIINDHSLSIYRREGNILNT